MKFNVKRRLFRCSLLTTSLAVYPFSKNLWYLIMAGCLQNFTTVLGETKTTVFEIWGSLATAFDSYLTSVNKEDLYIISFHLLLLVFAVYKCYYATRYLMELFLYLIWIYSPVISGNVAHYFILKNCNQYRENVHMVICICTSKQYGVDISVIM